MAEKFRIKKPRDQQEVSRELDYNSYQVGPNHTVRNPQDQKAYDPWADWFNAGLDPEPFTDNFYVEPEESNPPLFFAESLDHSAPWFIPEEQQQYQGEQETPPTPAQQEYPGEYQYYGYTGFPGEYLENQDNPEQRPVEAEQTSDYVDVSSAVTEEEPLTELGSDWSKEEPVAEQSIERSPEEPAAEVGPEREESPEEVEVEEPNQEEQQSETTMVETKSNLEDENMGKREKEFETQKEKTARNNQEPLVWKDFPAKSC